MIRRLESLAGLDPEIERSVERARTAAAPRCAPSSDAWPRGRPTRRWAVEETTDVLHMLTSFDTFDELAGAARSPEEVATLLIRLAHPVVGLDQA